MSYCVGIARLCSFASVRSPKTGTVPAVDGNLTPDLQGYLFFQGHFRKDTDILVAGDIDEVPRLSILFSICANTTN